MTWVRFFAQICKADSCNPAKQIANSATTCDSVVTCGYRCLLFSKQKQKRRAKVFFTWEFSRLREGFTQIRRLRNCHWFLVSQIFYDCVTRCNLRKLLRITAESDSKAYGQEHCLQSYKLQTPICTSSPTQNLLRIAEHKFPIWDWRFVAASTGSPKKQQQTTSANDVCYLFYVIECTSLITPHILINRSHRCNQDFDATKIPNFCGISTGKIIDMVELRSCSAMAWARPPVSNSRTPQRCMGGGELSNDIPPHLVSPPQSNDGGE